MIERFVVRGQDRLFHVVEINRDAAAGGVMDEFEAVPPIGLPRRADSARGGDGFAIGVIHEVNLMMNAVGFFAEMGVVEPRVVLPRKGEAEVVVARIEFRELTLDRKGERFPFRGLEPREVEGTAHLRLMGLLSFQSEYGLALFFAPRPCGGIGKSPSLRRIEGTCGFGGEQEMGG